ncbi:MAG: flavodoxin [Lachnospiraceae bacterium]|nr:flavodoxin [Lachnospiraceae bacterium]
MSEIIVAYWSGTGNTETMANAVAEGIKAAGGTPKVVSMEDMQPEELKSCSSFAMGCPAMGAEELEDTIVEPFVAAVENFCSGKRLGLFGSYDWGDGEWMRAWAKRMDDAGAFLTNEEGLIANLEPDEEALEACRAMGKALV